MGEPDEPLTGFSWKSGADRVTTGIIFWYDVFLHTNETTGEKLAIFIVDTQGLFDHETNADDNSKVFYLSSLISSIQILNIKDNVEERDIEYLRVS
jgi:atlastin